jgi:hybrid cluster-associated redox disulfide protein
MSENMTITKDLIIADVLKIDMDLSQVFMEMGMFCVTCPASLGESVEEACMVHGIDPDEMLVALNEFLANKNKAE